MTSTLGSDTSRQGHTIKAKKTNVKLASRKAAFKSGFCSCSEFQVFWPLLYLCIKWPSQNFEVVVKKFENI